MTTRDLSIGEVSIAVASKDADTVLRGLHDLLWPSLEPARQWEVDTIEYVAQIVDAYFPGLLDQKRKEAPEQ